jgi:two-component system nitrogen regulation response regulator GlnG
MSGQVLLPEFLPETVRRGNDDNLVKRSVTDHGDQLETWINDFLNQGKCDVYEKVIAAVDRVLLTKILNLTQGHQAQASEILGMNRATLRSKLKTLGLSVDKIVSEDTQGS